ncbi:hypothetical protein [Limibacterium fermenti]|uniref:hypothetical protein n=1 Tax=Limibacterium fermenti TaxID=3229863 RepID=UPI003A68E5AA
MIKTILLFIVSLFLICGCNSYSDNLPFTYKYSIESMGNFKVNFELNSDSTYKISQFNYFFDRLEGRKRAFLKDGKLTKQEFITFQTLISASKIERLKDTYGFEDAASEREIIFMIELIRNGKSKYVSINSHTSNKFPKHFPDLIKHTNEFISEKIN